MLAKLLNNCNGPHYVQMQPLQKAASGRVIQPGELIIIEKGMNLIDTKKLAAMREQNPGFASLFTATILSSKAPDHNSANDGKPYLEVLPGELPDDKPLAKLSDKDTKEIIEKTENTDVLLRWKQDAKPDTVRREIDARIKFLTQGIEPDTQLGL